jgi:hypothetical protein
VLARWLRQQNHEVFSVYEHARGMEDERIIHTACEENWILNFLAAGADQAARNG